MNFFIENATQLKKRDRIIQHIVLELPCAQTLTSLHCIIDINPLTAKDKLSCPGPQGGYQGALQPMLPCVTLYPLIAKIKI